MKISREDVLRVAQLAHLELAPEEVETYRGQLDEILAYIGKLQELDVSNVEPMTQMRSHGRCAASGSAYECRPRRCNRRRAGRAGATRRRGGALQRRRCRVGGGAGRRQALLPRSKGNRAMSAAPTWTIASVREALLAKKTSARELAKEFYAQIEQRNPELNAFLALCPERAYAQADRVDAIVAQGKPLAPLAGVPVAIKDVISTEGVRTTCGSKILENYTPPYDATAIERLEKAGAVILGKTNCDEFAMGSSNENSAYGPVRNPDALDRVPGGSSGGSAAAVAAGLSVVALGTDTGGSIRQPGAYCGVPAMMPTYGRVSRYGLIAFASSLDRIGPFATNISRRGNRNVSYRRTRLERLYLGGRGGTRVRGRNRKARGRAANRRPGGLLRRGARRGGKA